MYDYDTLKNEDTETIEIGENKMSSLNHSYICLQIIKQIAQNEQFEPLPELTLNIESGLTPDISVFPKDKIKPNFLRDKPKFDEIPTLAIEVISMSQGVHSLIEKARKFIDGGIKTVWTIEPYGRTIFVTTKDGETIFHDETVESEGIRVDFKKIFG